MGNDRGAQESANKATRIKQVDLSAFFCDQRATQEPPSPHVPPAFIARLHEREPDSDGPASSNPSESSRTLAARSGRIESSLNANSSLTRGAGAVTPLQKPGSSCQRISAKKTQIVPSDRELVPREVVIDRNGQPRQAGAECKEGEYIKRYKRRAEQSLFVFLKGVVGRFFLTPHFHRDVCGFIQLCPPFRKLVLMPREHAKTTIVAGGLPPHILIQPKEGNIYFPGMEGSECRILLSGETAPMAQKNLRVVKNVFMENRLFRAFWPHRCWESERAAKTWNNDSIIIPRENEWPDPTIKAVGVGGAITGSRPNVMIKDDLVSFAAANSEVVMDEAIEWHKASRALLDTYEIESGLQSLEFIIGTRWAVYDLYSEIIDNDPSVEVNDERFHRIIRDGKILWPEKYSLEMIDQLRNEHGSNFYLLYLNSAADPSLTDFDTELVRDFWIHNGMICFEEDERDLLLERNYRKGKERARKVVNGEDSGKGLPKIERGERLNAIMLKRLAEATGNGMRIRA